MNCQTIIKSIGFNCTSINDSVLSIHTPFSFMHDGQLINLYVIDLKNGKYKVTDGMETAYLLSSMGVNINRKRIQSFTKTIEFEGVEIESNGELFVISSEDKVPYAITSLISACISLSNIAPSWVEKSEPVSFLDRVANVLKEHFENVEMNISVTGMSGHEYIMPIVVKEDHHSAYIHTIGTKNGSISWPDVTKVVGIMTDIKQADISNVGRFVIIDDAHAKNLKEAETLLSTCSNTLPFSRKQNWLESIAA